MTQDINVVGIGGGSGLSVLLAGLRRAGERSARDREGAVRVSAIVSVADDGGSTGKLRRHLGIPAVGDLRNCIVALAGGDPLWNELFQHRFGGGDGLNGHALGNLIVAALVQRSGGLRAGIEQLTRPLRLGGRVLPVTEERVSLCAELEDGEVVLGESQIPLSGRRIDRVWLSPPAPRPALGVLDTLAAADAIVLGPGSLFTSVVPNLLVEGVPEAIRASGALKVFVCNLMTQPGETDGFDAVDHLRVIERYLGHGVIDVCLVHHPYPVLGVCDARVEPGAEPVSWTREAIEATGAFPITADLAAGGARLDRHDPGRLGELVLSLARSLRHETAPGVAAAAAFHQPAALAAAPLGVE
jgi:uncharacterized cofD-like protein